MRNICDLASGLTLFLTAVTRQQLNSNDNQKMTNAVVAATGAGLSGYRFDEKRALPVTGNFRALSQPKVILAKSILSLIAATRGPHPIVGTTYTNG